MNVSGLVTGLVVLALSQVSVVPLAAAGSKSRCDVQPLVSDIGIEGRATLCVTSSGLRARMRTKRLVVGDAYTVWWVYFDDPSSCEVPGQCGSAADFAGPNPLAVFGRMDSVVARHSGRAGFSGSVRGLEPSPGSQIWLWLFGHGEADTVDKRHLARQLLTPEDPSAGKPHLGNDVDGPLGFSAGLIIFDIPE